ncbi:MAG: sulfatase [Kiritimatiellales bacterium]|nr:sulfatase [Kiritimatiellales bacterium]
MKRRNLIRSAMAAAMLPAAFVRAKAAQLNILLITADDLGYEAVGCLNKGLPDLTPNLDRFAREGMMFNHGHTNTPICQPSRATIASGRYGHTSGMMGFIHLKKKIPTIMQSMREQGYRTGVLGKVDHSTPDMAYKWDFVYDYGDLGAGRSPKLYHQYCKEFFVRCKKEGKPFYMMVNSHDPHRPFHNPDGRKMKDAEEPSKLFKPSEVVVQKNLSDLPQVREELSWYYNSVRRLDDTFGKVIQALEESGQRQNTLVMFLSDNGAAVPFAKANVYLASTRTPWFVQWPGVVTPGAVDREHFVSAIDFFPTVMEATGLPAPAGVDGRSFAPLLKGGKQDGRDVVFKQVDYLIGGPVRPMRSIQDKKYGYIFNAWSIKGANYRNNNEGLCMKAMQEDPASAERVKMWRDRVVEEFYDLENDPGCLNNLAGNPEYKELADKFRTRMRTWMAETKDPAIGMFDDRSPIPKMQGYLKEEFPTKEALMPEAQLKEKEAKAAAKKAKSSKKSGSKQSGGKGKSDEERAAIRKARRAAKQTE